MKYALLDAILAAKNQAELTQAQAIERIETKTRHSHEITRHAE